MGETANIASIADKVSEELFWWFKWRQVGPKDENFICVLPQEHGSKKSRLQPEHPVDVVYNYFDPYLGKNVYINTDLKSYGKSSYNNTSLKNSLISLAKSIECAEGSQEWRKKYVDTTHKSYEVRGFLFIFNHDGDHDKLIEDHLNQIPLERVPLRWNQKLHIISTQTINFLRTLVTDLLFLRSKNEFPSDNQYSFFYPDLILHKAQGDLEDSAATIEMLCSPFLIINFDRFLYKDQFGIDQETQHPGYIVYYNKNGETVEEFLYLIDYLSQFQILNTKCTIKIRVINHDVDSSIKSNFDNAKKRYASDWGGDKYKTSLLERIDFDVVTTMTDRFISETLGWRSA